MALIPCDECGKQVSDKAAACPNCGNPIAKPLPVVNDPELDGIAREERERAKRFGIAPGATHPSAGRPLAGGGTTGGSGGSGKRILPAAILAFLLGFLGIHRFYVGKTGTGFVMLVLSFTGIGLCITGIWALIDLVLIVVGSFEDADGLTLTEWT